MATHWDISKIRSNASLAVWIDHLARLDAGRVIQQGAERKLKAEETHVRGSSQYSENIVAIIFTTMPSLVSSVAVTSMKTFRVFKVILLWSELMIGGIESTVRFES